MTGYIDGLEPSLVRGIRYRAGGSGSLFDLFLWIWEELKKQAPGDIECKLRRRYIGLWYDDEIFAWVDIQSRNGVIKIGVKKNLSQWKERPGIQLVDFPAWSTSIREGVEIWEKTPAILEILRFCM